MRKPWEQRKIGELFSKSTEKGKDGIPILSVSIHFGVSSSELDDEDLGKFVRRSEDKSLYLKVDPGDVVLNMMRAWQGGIGVSRSVGMVSPAYIVAKPSIPFDSSFLNELIRSHKIIQKIDNLSYGVTDFRKRLYWESFSQIDLQFPSLEEQKKIGNLIQKLDSFIDLEQHQLDLLKEQKKGLLQKLFPKDGSDVPELRFTEFTGPWEQRKLETLGKTYSGLSGKSKEDFGHGEAQFVTYLNVFNNSIGNPNEVEFIEIDSKQHCVQKGDILFTTSSETPEEVGMSCVWPLNKENLYLNSFCFGFRPYEPIEENFYAFLLRSPSVRSKITVLAQGISRYNISKNKMMEIEINLPSLKEQKKIGDFFSNLDNLITLHQRKLELLKEQKKGLLQKMFPKEGEDASEVRFPEFR